ncbi:hypothetical protein JCM9492_13600 [Aquifex pyrophilus]
MSIKLPEKSILDELAEKKDRIIEEGNLYLAYIYSSLSRQPKRVYRFEDLLQNFKTLRVVYGKNEIQLRGIEKNREKPATPLKTTKKELLPYFREVVRLFVTYKTLEDEEFI